MITMNGSYSAQAHLFTRCYEKDTDASQASGKVVKSFSDIFISNV